MDTLINFGAEVKALGDGKLGGYLVVFGDEKKTDLTGDFFTSKTDFGSHQTTAVLYHHGLDKRIGKTALAEGTLKADDTGVWLEAQLNMADEYQAMIYGMAEKGKLGLSSGTAPHLVEREPAGKAQRITRWPLGLDASLTPTPAEPRTLGTVVPLKALVDEVPAGEAKALTLSEISEQVRNAVREALYGPRKPNTEWPWVSCYVYSDAVIYRPEDSNKQFVSRGWAMVDGVVQLGETVTPVAQEWMPVGGTKEFEMGGSLGELSFADHTETALGVVREWQERLRWQRPDAQARKAGRVLSDKNRQRLTAMCEQVESAAQEMRKMLVDTMPMDGEQMQKALATLRLEFARGEARHREILAGVTP